MSQVFSDLPQVIVYIDDLLTGSSNPGKHLEILEKVLRRMERVGYRPTQRRFSGVGRKLSI